MAALMAERWLLPPGGWTQEIHARALATTVSPCADQVMSRVATLNAHPQ